MRQWTPVAGRVGDRSNAGSLPPAHALPEAPTAPPAITPPRDLGPLTGTLAHPKSRWVPVGWSELPGFGEDPLHEAWVAMLSQLRRAPTPPSRRCAASAPAGHRRRPTRSANG
jgi:hypothetical protein